MFQAEKFTLLENLYLIDVTPTRKLLTTLGKMLCAHEPNFPAECEKLKKIMPEGYDLVTNFSAATAAEERQQIKDDFCPKPGLIAFEIATEFFALE